MVRLLLVPMLAVAQRQAWQPVFSEEFEGAELNLTRWIPRDPLAGSGSSNPLHYGVADGVLHMTGPAAVSTFGTFARPYGRFEIRCRVNPAKGLRARFRLMPVPLSQLPAIDVFDVTGDDTKKAGFANTWGTPQTERSFGDSVVVTDLSVGFHIIAVEWERDSIVWLVDGKEKFKSTEGVPSLPAWLSIDVGGGALDIDYIRVSRRP